MPAHWNVTWNHLDDTRMDIHGPDSWNTHTPTPFHFKLFDDDDELYFTGTCSEISFTPLDDYGAAFGCTYIQYYIDGHWRTL